MNFKDERRKINVTDRNVLFKQIEESPASNYEEVNTVQITRSVEKDNSLDSQILKIISSGFYTFKPDSNIFDSTDSIAIKKLKKMIYSVSAQDFVSEKSHMEWEHSYSASILMKKMIEENELPVSSNLPVAVLMHDVGKIFLLKYRPQKYKMAQTSAKEKGVPLHIEEESVLKITHAEVSGFLMKKWDMTEDMTTPVYYHHRKDIPNDYVLETALMKFVDWMDYYLRGMPCVDPEPAIMSAAGIEEIDKRYWIKAHQEIIASTHDQYFKNTDTSRLKKAIKRDTKSDTLPFTSFTFNPDELGKKE